MENDKNELSKRFLALRKKLDLTQHEISEIFDVHYTSWQGWEYGTTRPHSKYIRILERLEKNPPKLLRMADMCRFVRNQLGLKKYQMAELLNVAAPTWATWEKGEKKPSNEFIIKIKEMYQELIEKEPLQKAS
jgi:DNA-binding transcriptional regulator YiaG